MRTLALISVLICLPVCVLALANNQLYTGDPSTVPPGKTQAQLFGDTTLPSRTKVWGVELRHGLTSNVDAKIAYSYLWNLQGPNAQIGPNVGAKWRFAGDGMKKPSLAISTLWVIDQSGGGHQHKGDYGASLIASYPGHHGEFLFNYGHVWVGDNIPDLQYLGLARAQQLSKRVIVALEYSSIQRVSGGGPPTLGGQVVAGLVYGDLTGTSYGLQVGYLLDTKIKWHTTLGVSTYF